MPLTKAYANGLIKITSIMLNTGNEWYPFKNHCCPHQKDFSSKTGDTDENHIGSRTWYIYIFW